MSEMDERLGEMSFHMADIRSKRPTARRAVAAGEIHVGPSALELIMARRLPKGDALAMAEVAGIQGAKSAAQLLPLCHPLTLDLVRVQVQPEVARTSMRVYCEVAACAKTGVEMEALAGATTALLTLYDLAKPVEPGLTLRETRLLFKEGGKKGLWIHPEGLSDEERVRFQPHAPVSMMGIRVGVITLSDRAHAGVYADHSGPEAVRALTALGAELVNAEVLPDDLASLAEALTRLAASGIDLVLCTGGTGLGPRDIAPEALASVATRRVPGLAEYFRQASSHHMATAWLSRAEVALVNQTLVILLPGHPRAVVQGLDILLPLVPHALAMVRGASHP
ncbi:Bifunctional molybdenum cofactor biosynthesis protein MoaC/MogA [mine drainage metagenome]|uniref:Bifunctional molybdenum cofactor biosynthesis protein MoaC/MogA n=1 Tax=mine drainage metagenome TaxID=410659 RepID=T1CCC3_9ZZZZ